MKSRLASHCANNLGSDAAEVLGRTDTEHCTYKNHCRGCSYEAK